MDRRGFECWKWKIILRMGVTGKISIAHGVESEWEERKWMLEEKGWGVRGEAPGKGKGQPGQTQSPVQHRLPCQLSPHHLCCCANLLGTHEPQPQASLVLVYHSEAGSFRRIICFISTNTLIWVIWQKEVMPPCMLPY